MAVKRRGNIQIGDMVGMLTVIGSTTHGKKNEFHWQCKCECGSEKVVVVRNAHLLSGAVRSCGCYRIAHLNTTGLGSGWDETCQSCGISFRAKSANQIVCSTDCRFALYKGQGPEDHCWNWAGPKNAQGYGVLSMPNRGVMAAHRYAFEKYNHEIDASLCVMHTCDNPSCTNPAHLRLGTWAENNADRSAKGRSGSRNFSAVERLQYSDMNRGELNSFAILTEDQAKEIKYDKTSKRADLAKKFGVSIATIKAIRSGRNWSHI